METPDWLKANDADVEAGSTTELDTPTSQSTTDTTTNKNNNGGDDSPGSSSKRSFTCSCGAAMVLLISTAFLGLFVYSAIVQNNDGDGLQWLIFYALNGALVAMFMLYYMCCFPQKAIYGLGFGMTVWAIVYIVIASLNFRDAPKGGDKAGTGDNDNQTLREEIGYEIGGASLGALSALYHVFMVKCCVNKNKPE